MALARCSYLCRLSDQSARTRSVRPITADRPVGSEVPFSAEATKRTREFLRVKKAQANMWTFGLTTQNFCAMHGTALSGGKLLTVITELNVLEGTA